MDIFLTWCTQQGIKHDSVDIKQTNYGGHGLFLNTTRTNSTPLVHIPPKLLITASSLLNYSAPNDNCYLTDFMDILNTVLEPDTLTLEERIKLPGNEKKSLRLFLAYEIHHGRTCKRQQSSSFWQPYVNNLPSLSFFKQNHVLFFEDDGDNSNLFALLEGTSMASSIRAKQASLQREWQGLRSLLPWQLTLDDWMYCDVLFWSRVVELTTEADEDEGDSNSDSDDDNRRLAMIPFFDFANHRMEPNLRWQLTKQTDGGGLDLVSSGAGIECGQELCLSYGAKSNQELLFLHGFTLDQNPTSGQVTLPLAPFLNPGQGQDSVLKWQWMQQQDNPPFKPILILAQPSTIGSFGHTGWTFESICMLYLAALDNDDGLELTTYDTSVENAVDDLNQLHLSLSSKENSKNYHGTKIYLDGTRLTTWNDLSAAVLALPHASVIQLRVTMMLLDASQYHLQQITAHDDLQVPESPLLSHIVRYREEERLLLQQSVNALSLIAERLMDSDTVKEYLDNINSGVDGE